MIRFLHTGDWQLGMNRHYFSAGVQERFTQSRFDAIRELGRIAVKEKCRFMVVCGDIFEANLLERQTVARALEALKEISVPVYLLPGNHDPLNAGSIYHSPTFLDKKPDHIHVIEDTRPIKIDRNIEIVGAAWRTKKPLRDLVAEAIAPLKTAAGTLRICVAHGIVDSLSPDPDDPALVSQSAAETALKEGKIHYLALGDRHSVTEIGATGRIWYSGTPEPTDYDEVKSGYAIIAEVDEGQATVRPVKIGTWNFIEYQDVYANTEADVENIEHRLNEIQDKERTVVKLRLIGTISLALHSRLENTLQQARDVLGALEVRDSELTIAPEEQDFTNFGFTGFAEKTVAKLREMSADSHESAVHARDALALLMRLAGRTQ